MTVALELRAPIAKQLLLDAGQPSITGTLSVTLDSATAEAVASIALVGALAVGLDGATASAAGGVAMTGDLAATTEEASGAAAATVSALGVGAATAGPATLAGSGSPAVPGQGDVGAGPAWMDAAAAIGVLGSLEATTAQATVTGFVVITSNDIIGQLAVTLEGAALTGEAGVAVSGAGSVGAGPAVGSAVIAVPVSGAAALSGADVLLAGDVAMPLAAEATIVLLPAGLVAAGSPLSLGELDIDLEDATLVAVATLDARQLLGILTVRPLPNRLQSVIVGNRVAITLIPNRLTARPL